MKNLILIFFICILTGRVVLQAADEKQGPKIGENWVADLADDVKLEMIYIPPGTFKMGSSENEPYHFVTEKLHTVTLTKGFWIGKYEVTLKQWQAVKGDELCHRWKWKEKDIPVHNIDWYEANDFCWKLNRKEIIYTGRLPSNYRYVLPTESQWEYACRSGTKTSLNNGKDITAIYKTKFWGYGELLAHLGIKSAQGYWTDCPNLNEVAWYYNNSEGKPHPVGLKKPNAYGLYDMLGNMSEWCADRDLDYPTRKNNIDPISIPANSDPLRDGIHGRILRGGCYGSVDDCRQASRSGCVPGFTTPFIGFRLALVYFDSEEEIPVKSIQIQFADIPHEKDLVEEDE